ncbi:MAG TPA: DUF4288 domain-containing protein [Mucilaginibacter sp.]|nr:DUF4288 domain-containing protein [Mucilaginibacter sp.]
MNWYVAKIVFRIVTGDGNHHPQFDEQLRLINAENECQAYEKAACIGHLGQESFTNNQSETVRWDFIGVAELNFIGELSDGAELYYQIHEAPDPDLYVAWAQHRSALLSIKN